MGQEGDFHIQLDALAKTKRALSICSAVQSDVHGLQVITDVVDVALYHMKDDLQQCISQWPSHLAESCESSLSCHYWCLAYQYDVLARLLQAHQQNKPEEISKRQGHSL
jgi:hypothetical protein